jgi:hypothetical protein
MSHKANVLLMLSVAGALIVAFLLGWGLTHVVIERFMPAVEME